MSCGSPWKEYPPRAERRHGPRATHDYSRGMRVSRGRWMSLRKPDLELARGSGQSAARAPRAERAKRAAAREGAAAGAEGAGAQARSEPRRGPRPPKAERRGRARSRAGRRRAEAAASRRASRAPGGRSAPPRRGSQARRRRRVGRHRAGEARPRDAGDPGAAVARRRPRSPAPSCSGSGCARAARRCVALWRLARALRCASRERHVTPARGGRRGRAGRRRGAGRLAVARLPLGQRRHRRLLRRRRRRRAGARGRDRDRRQRARLGDVAARALAALVVARSLALTGRRRAGARCWSRSGSR